MREAVGGSILFYIILGFVAVYIIFIGVIMNYAATFRASNYVVTTLEEYEGNAKYAKVIEKLIAIEQEVEEMYMDMSSPDDEVTDDEDFES